MITVVNKVGCCPTQSQDCILTPHNHDERYYTKEEINEIIQELSDEIEKELQELDDKISAIVGQVSKVILGQGVPAQSLGNKDDLYIDYANLRRPIYNKTTGSWVKITNLNEVDNEILEVTTEV